MTALQITLRGALAQRAQRGFAESAIQLLLEEPSLMSAVMPVEGLRVQWHLAHRSRARKEGKAAAPVSRPVAP